MSFFEWFIDFGWFGFHPFSALIYIIQFIYIAFFLRGYGVWALVYSMASVTFAIHVYESGHAFSLYSVLGYTGPVWYNLSIAIGVFVSLVIFNRHHKVLVKNPKIPLFFLFLFGLSLASLIESGFFANYPYTITRGAICNQSKIMATVFASSLFWRSAKC